MHVPTSSALSDPREEWDQGDIVEAVYFPANDAKLPGVLLTPTCDIGFPKKATRWTFVALFPDVEIARTVIDDQLPGQSLERDADGKLNLSNKRAKQLRKALRELLCHHYDRYHWIPVVIASASAHMADFTCITSIRVEEVRDTLKRIASLRPSWREQLAARYAAYMGRIGTDDFAKDEIDAHIDRLLAGAHVIVSE